MPTPRHAHCLQVITRPWCTCHDYSNAPRIPPDVLACYVRAFFGERAIELCWLLAVGGCWWLLLVACCLLLVACCLLLVACCLLPVACWLLLVACCLLVAGCWLLVVGCGLLVVG